LTGDAAIRASCAEVATRIQPERWMQQTCELIESL
jgi:hypothetical protein